MSIANKLIYLNTTKENLKESINNIGGSITDDTTFRNYATELDNIYSNIPKTIGEGSNLSLSTIKGRINYDDILGDTEQDGTPTPSTPIDIEVVTGTQEVVVQNKNKLPSGESGTYTSNYATHTSNGKGVYTINGTATGQSFHNFQVAPYTIKSGDYLHLGNSVANSNVAIALLVSGSEQIMFRSCSTANAIQDLSSYAGKVVNYVRTFTNAQTLSNFEIKPMICNSSTQTDFVEHQEQTKTLHLSSKNLFDGQFRQGSRFTTGLADTTRLFTTQNYPVKSGQAYTLSTTLNTSTFKYAINLCSISYPITTSQGSSQFYDSSWKTSSSFTFTPAQDGYLGIVIAKSNGTDSLTPSDIADATWQVEEGSTATTYEPYYNYELSKIGTYQDRIFESSGKNLTELSSISTTGGGYINYSVSQLAEVEQGKTYTLSLKNNTSYTSNLNIRITSGNTYSTETYGNLIANGITSYTFTASQSGTLNLNSRLGTADTTNALTQIMLNYGSTALPYEPYGSGKWYIEKNIGKVVLKDVPQGTNNWTKSNAYSTNDYFCGFCGFATSIKTNSYYILCNKLVNALYTDTTTSECIANDSETINLKIKASRLSENSPTGLANYLANEGSDIYILYILKTPTYTEITNTALKEELNELEKMMSYSGQTNISISGNLPMLVSVSALKGE